MPSAAPRRRYPRQLRRLAVRFWREGEDRARQGFTKNLSLTGAFVSTPDPAGRGERLRLELSDAGRRAVVDAVVVHSHRVPPELRRFAESAMGLRFLALEDLVGPFLDREALQPESEEAAGGRAGEGTGASAAGGEPAAAGSAPATGSSPLPTAGPPATYSLRFATGNDFLATYRRDLLNGGLFVTTDRPARLHERVTVDLHLPGASAPTVRVEGRVVQVVDPRPLASGRTAGGMGLELVDPDAAIARLAPHVSAYER